MGKLYYIEKIKLSIANSVTIWHPPIQYSMKYTVPLMTYSCQKFLSDYTKPLDLLSSLQELQRIKERDKWCYEETIRQI